VQLALDPPTRLAQAVELVLRPYLLNHRAHVFACHRRSPPSRLAWLACRGPAPLGGEHLAILESRGQHQDHHGG
jgi:hypothetical protein